MASTYEPAWAKEMAAASAKPANNDEEVVLEFLAGMSTDPIGYIEKLYADTDKVTYQNVPSVYPLAVGKSAVIKSMKTILKAMDMEEIVTFGLASKGGYVFTERIDRLKSKAGVRYDLPVMGVFKVENGKIVDWRDYFDLMDTQKGMSEQAPGLL